MINNLILAAIGAVIYVIPAIIAIDRQHPQAAPIVVINFCLGWTLIGWAVALAWACSAMPTNVAAEPLGMKPLCSECHAPLPTALTPICPSCGVVFVGEPERIR